MQYRPWKSVENIKCYWLQLKWCQNLFCNSWDVTCAAVLLLLLLCKPQKRVYSAQNKQQKLQLKKACINHTKQSLDQLGCG